MLKLFEFLENNAEYILAALIAVYELFVRLIPTYKNWSVIETVLNWLRQLIPNRRKPPVSIILILLCSMSAMAQLNGNFKSIRLTVNDTVQALPINGTIIYNTPTQSFYAYENFGWTKLISSGGDTTDIPFVSPENFGAVGDGVTNDAPAITAAIASGQPVYFSKKNYRVNSTINIPDNTQILGSGQGSIISTVANIAIFTLTGNNSSISNLTFQGNDTGAIQDGINAVGNAGLTVYRISNRISNCYFNDLGRSGIYVQDMVGNPSSLHQGAIYAINCVANSCANGFYLASRGEYNTFANCVALSCTNGVRLIGGNNNFVGGQIVDCTSGVRIETGTNDGHGVMSGVKINHNNTNVISIGLVQGYLFSDCMLYAGNVTISTSVGLRFEACEFSTVVFTITNSTPLQFNNCKFITTPTFTVTGTNPIFFNNYFIAGVIPSAVTNTITGKFTTTPTATLSGFNPGSVAADPSTLVNGDLWYNSSTNVLRARINGTSQTIPVSGSGTNGIPKADASGNLVSTGLISSAGSDLRADNGTANTSLFLASKGTGNIDLSLAGGIAGMFIRPAGTELTSSVNGSAGTDNLFSVEHEVKLGQIQFMYSSTTTTLQGGHLGTGVIPKQTFVVRSRDSNNDNNGGDDFTVIAGNGSTTVGHDTSPGGTISITSGTGGNDSNGGNITFTIGQGTGTGVAGNVIFTNLPTSAAGLPTGALWNNAGVLNIAP